MKKTIHINQNNRGAASVLVIFFMLVLVALGAFAIVSSNANYRLSQRAIAYNETFYELDARAEEYMAHIDRILAEAETEARRHIQTGSELPADLRGAITPDMDTTRLFNAVYMYWADLWLTERLDLYPAPRLFPSGSRPLINGIWVQYTLQSERNPNSFIQVMLELDPALYVDAGDGFAIDWMGNGRFVISDWYEYQVVEPAEPIAVWDGVLIE
jgi:hypothetical protein